MKYRKLRIAWSVTWGVVAVLLAALWVRSYWRNDLMTRHPNSGLMAIGCNKGVLYLVSFYFMPGLNSHGWNFATANIESSEANNGRQPPLHFGYYLADDMLEIRPDNYQQYLGFVFHHVRGQTFVAMPMWCAITTLSAAIAAPWLRWRFSLRTLLIATTLVAVGLGLIVWLTR